ncbi:hypothetical protein H696_05667 [Fonticula alba]|uniref:Methyltransferase n=1 Tax=Fonticula alba TaxID=691883 RepID=A0A058Z359_FONAL|nr:hypothetical protein H696_05667 [Fonticula alba]KCV67942.1 hypothetical protein H696_05667 [Fonticula alba]|eukprot:XP_009497762.1 hypothetical protein H696_05667 [Fonticula alba]
MPPQNNTTLATTNNSAYKPDHAPLNPTLPLTTGVAPELINDTVTNYNNYWSADIDKNDKNVETRTTSYANLTNSYYDLVTSFYQFGWGESFHFANTLPQGKEKLAQACQRHQHQLVAQLRLPHLAGSPEAKQQLLLDVGCGIGGPMREIARFTGARVIGINNNEHQSKIGRAINYKDRLAACPDAGIDGARPGMHPDVDASQTAIVTGDMMELPFEDNTFDGVYAIEATLHAPKLVDCYAEILRTLKPGARFAVYEWVLTNFDPEDMSHRELRRNIEIGNGIANLVTDAEARQAMLDAGFELEFAVNMADPSVRPEALEPWYEALKAGNTSQSFFSIEGFRSSAIGRTVTDYGVWALEKLRLAPTGSHEVSQVLMTAAQFLAEGGERRLFTPMYLMVGRKPE